MSTLTEAHQPDWRFVVERESDVPQVVTGATQFCLQHGLTPILAAHVATAASELANNLWMHASHGGTIGLRRCQQGDRWGVELSANDSGPGIPDLSLALHEGWSSAGGMGCGLPGVQRLMDTFEIHSDPSHGTIVRARKWATGRTSESPWPHKLAHQSMPDILTVATLSEPRPGESVCGDELVHVAVPGYGGHWLAVIDGLGHGQPAAHAARLARTEVEAQARQMAGRPAALLRQLDAMLSNTRGAAMGLAWIQEGTLRFVGLGNTRCLRWRAGTTTRLPSQPGIVGEGLINLDNPELAVQSLSLASGDLILMYSDGLDEMLQIGNAMPPVWQDEPLLLARHLLSRWRRPSDDAAVLVAQVSAVQP